MPLTARRLQALVLTAVLLVGGSGASALDVALYHLGGHVEARAGERIAGTDAPRPHGDACALLDWAARGPYTVALDGPPALAPGRDGGEEPGRAPASPRPADLSAAPRPRGPPASLT
ncbi:MAG: hypothetical protein M3Y40_02770 [Chloroflexota bacterium]|nr:hypothetical protein [Chloroflexota bacterium]